MNELDVINKLSEITDVQALPIPFVEDSETAHKIAEHKIWLQNIRHEHPNPNTSYKIGIYIRYFNQTKYDNYLDYHKKQFIDTIKLCPNWELVDFYIDEGSTAPNMETAPEWCRLLNDAMDGKIDLIITQKVSNVSKKPQEVTICASLLACQPKPIGIYFISEDIYTLASYYQADMKDPLFFPSEDWKILPDTDTKSIGTSSND